MFGKFLSKKNENMLISYRTLRRVLGVIGMLMPFLCIAGGLVFGHGEVQRSVSHYYHTNMRDLLIGLLGSVSLFLFSYKGYGVVDDLVTWAIGLAGVGVFVFPCPTVVPSIDPLGIFQVPPDVSALLHLIFSGLFFGLLAVNSIFLFTRSRDKVPSRQKIKRNVVYIVCGIVILASLASLLVLFLAAVSVVETTSVALVFESIMLVSFGVSWLVKGETLFRDRKTAP